MNQSLLFLKSFYNLLKALFPIWGILAVMISVLGVMMGTLEGYWLAGGVLFRLDNRYNRRLRRYYPDEVAHQNFKYSDKPYRYCQHGYDCRYRGCCL